MPLPKGSWFCLLFFTLTHISSTLCSKCYSDGKLSHIIYYQYGGYYAITAFSQILCAEGVIHGSVSFNRGPLHTDALPQKVDIVTSMSLVFLKGNRYSGTLSNFSKVNLLSDRTRLWTLACLNPWFILQVPSRLSLMNKVSGL